MINARIDEKLKKTFPGLKIAHLEIDGIEVKRGMESLKKVIRRSREEIITRYSGIELTEDPHIKAYRDFIKKFNIGPSEQKAASEALIKMMLNKGRLPEINNVVDCMNIVSMRTGLTISAWDKDKIKGDVIVRYSKEGERYTPIGDEEMILKSGEIIETDDEKVLCLIRYRDCQFAMVDCNTKNLLIHVQGVEGVAEEEVIDAKEELKKLILEFAGGKIVKEDFLKL